MSTKSLHLEKILTLLAETPSHIAAASYQVTPPQLHTPRGPDEWSANDVLAHLRSCADIWGGCIISIIAEERPVLRAVNPRTWIKKTDYLEQEFHSSLQAFTAQRTKLLKVLEPLAPGDWLRKADVTGAGKPLVRTVHFYAQWLATHERPHIKQIRKIVETYQD
jgi:hypothetical protein